jgi:diacylglycerol kinase family enzyme
MNWSVVVAGAAPADLQTILTEAQAVAAPTLASPEAVAELCTRPNTSGILVIGGDGDLARIVSILRSSGRDLPLSLIPNSRSDLLAMFGLDRTGAIRRIQSGSPYRADLGQVLVDAAIRPFVAHVEASDSHHRLRRSDAVVITTARRSYQLEAWWVVAANAQHHAGRTIAPRAAVTDGELDIQVFSGSVLTKLRLLRLTRRGLHLRDRALWRRSVSSCSVDIPAGWAVTADGVFAGFGGFEVSIDAHAFDLWV